MLIVAQSMFLTVAGCGLCMFLWLHLFTYRRLSRHERIIDREEAKSEHYSTVQHQETQVAVCTPSPEQTQAALFMLYQEQVRRFIDAKISILCSAAETQNRIMLLQAQQAYAAPALPAPGADAVILGGQINFDDQLRIARENTECTLARIEDQIRSLPGPSVNQWISCQQNLAA